MTLKKSKLCIQDFGAFAERRFLKGGLIMMCLGKHAHERSLLAVFTSKSIDLIRKYFWKGQR
jgi:hypothetical protein